MEMIKVGQVYQDTICGCIDKVVRVSKEKVRLKVLRGCGRAREHYDEVLYSLDKPFMEDVIAEGAMILVPKVKAVLYE